MGNTVFRRSHLLYVAGGVSVIALMASSVWGDDRDGGLRRLPPVGAVASNSFAEAASSIRIAAAREQAPSPLPLEVLGLRRRSSQLELIAEQADALTQKGYDLAGRGAFFAARAQFRAALAVLAQGLDAEEGTTRHGNALSRAWTALEEAQDFLGPPENLHHGPALAELVGKHDTPILKDQDFSQVTALDAFRSYLAYAQDLFAQASEHEVAGSMALRGLGKLFVAVAERSLHSIREPSAQAVVFFQAAIIVCPENYMAANDLGVLLARGNRWQEAYQVLSFAARVRADEVVLSNLAKVRKRLGLPEPDSRSALGDGGMSPGSSPESSPPIPTVMWVPPEAIAEVDRSSSDAVALQHQQSTQEDPLRRLFFPRQGKSTRPTRLRAIADLTSGDKESQVATPAVTARQSSSEDNLSWFPTDDQGENGKNGTVRFPEASWTPSPASPCPRCAVDGSVCDPRHWGGWKQARLIAWERFAQGEYVGLARAAHVPEYRLRVDDELEIIYRITREATTKPYRLNVGDQIRVESATDPTLTRDVLIQPDGTITLLLLGQVKATGYTVAQLQQRLEQLYRRYYRVPSITVTPILVNSKLEDLRASVDRRNGEGGQGIKVRITPEGTISLPGLGSVRAQGLTLRELQLELNELYREEVEGIEAIPILVQRAPRYVYVLGEVANPGRFELTGPTTVIQAISMAGGWKPGANLRQIVVFRRGEDWRLMATMLNLEAALHGNKATPCDEIWLSDSDVVILPKSFIQRADDFIELVFTRGIYGVFPLSATINFSKLSTI